MGPVGQAVLRFIVLQSEGQHDEAAALGLDISRLMLEPVSRLVQTRRMSETRARLFVYLNALREIMDQGAANGIDEAVIVRATSMYNAFMQARHNPGAPRMRQRASRAAAARSGVGRNHTSRRRHPVSVGP